jgi:hypothetical protein
MDSHKKKKDFDAIEMKRRIQEEIYEETKDMSPDEFIAYIRERIGNSRFADFLDQPTPTTEDTPSIEGQRTNP